MKSNALSIIATLLAIAATGCSRQDSVESPLPETPQEKPAETIKIPISISSVLTKVSGDSFVADDAIGLYVVNATKTSGTSWASASLLDQGNHMDNVKFTYSGRDWAADKEYYWKDSETKADFYCYYPYKPQVGDVSGISFTVPADQSSKEKFESAEILWGRAALKSPTAEAIGITSSHRMSQFIIEIKPGKGFTKESLAQSLKSVTINNIRCEATLDLRNGDLSAEGAQNDVAPYFDGYTYRALIVPQTVSGKSIVTLDVDGIIRSLKQEVEFTSNTRKKCTITINKINEGVNVGIGGWEDDGVDYGGTLDGMDYGGSLN